LLQQLKRLFGIIAVPLQIIADDAAAVDMHPILIDVLDEGRVAEGVSQTIRAIF